MGVKCIFGYKYKNSKASDETYSQYQQLLEDLKTNYLIILNSSTIKNKISVLLNSSTGVNTQYFLITDSQLSYSYELDEDNEKVYKIDTFFTSNNRIDLIERKGDILQEFQNYYDAFIFITQNAINNNGSTSTETAYKYIGVTLFESKNNTDIDLTIDTFKLSNADYELLRKTISYLQAKEKPNLYLMYCNDSLIQ